MTLTVLLLPLHLMHGPQAEAIKAEHKEQMAEIERAHEEELSFLMTRVDEMEKENEEVRSLQVAKAVEDREKLQGEVRGW